MMFGKQTLSKILCKWKQDSVVTILFSATTILSAVFQPIK